MASRKISKPTEVVFWVVTDGTRILHQGVTETSQVTETGLGDLIESSTLDGLIAQLGDYKSLLPTLPGDPRDEQEDRIYNDKGTLRAPKRKTR